MGLWLWEVLKAAGGLFLGLGIICWLFLDHVLSNIPAFANEDGSTKTAPPLIITGFLAVIIAVVMTWSESPWYVPKETPKNTTTFVEEYNPQASSYEEEPDYANMDIDEIWFYRDDYEAMEIWREHHPFDPMIIGDYYGWLDSSSLDGCGYYWPYDALGIIFSNHDDDLYVYFGVPRDIYEGLITADSPGKYYNKYIKGQYDVEKYD